MRNSHPECSDSDLSHLLVAADLLLRQEPDEEDEDDSKKEDEGEDDDDDTTADGYSEGCVLLFSGERGVGRSISADNVAKGVSSNRFDIVMALG